MKSKCSRYGRTPLEQETFFSSGTQHSVIGEGAFTVASDGSSLLPWMLDYAADAPVRNHAGP